MKKYNIQEAIAKRRIIPFFDAPKLIKKELQGAENDLQDAKDICAQGKYKWATIQAYFSIFHASRALLYKSKYREKSHIHLAFAIKALYVEAGILPEEYYDNIIQAMSLREMADYKLKFSQQGAERNIEYAENALALAKNVIKNNKTK